MGFTVDIKGNASHLDKTLKGVEKSLSNLGSVATTGLKSLAGIGIAGGAAMIGFIALSSKAAADIEDLGIQFEVLTGSAKKATDLISQFREEEKKSSLSTQDYAEAAKLLLANNVAYEDLLPTLRMIGDVSMGNSERFGRVALALGQISSKTKLAATETNQLAESGFNPLQQMVKMTGEAYSDLLKKQEAGQISFKDVAEAMKFATSEGGLFYKAIEKGSAGTNAKINQTRAAVTQLQVAFGTGFNQGLKDALDAANTYLPQLENKFEESGQIVGNAISKAVKGNSEQLALVGSFIGEVILAGIEAAIVIGFQKIMNIGDNILTATGSELATTMSLITGGGGGNYFKEFSKPKSMAPVISRAMNQVSQSETLSEMRKNNARLQDSIDMKDFGKTTKDATKAGIKEGIKEVWYSLETGAKFSN